MKLVFVAALGLILGLFLGALGPRSEMRRLRRDLEEAQSTAAVGRTEALPAAMGLGALMAARSRANEQATAAQASPASPTPQPSPSPGLRITFGGSTKPDGGTDADSSEEGRRGSRGFADPESFEKVRAAAEMRSAQFRAAFVEAAGLDAEHQTRLDDITRRMNQDFARAADEVAATLTDKGRPPTPRDMADVGVKLLQIYQRADDSMHGALTPEQNSAAEKVRFDLLTQVDVAAFRRLGEIAAKADRPTGPRP